MKLAPPPLHLRVFLVSPGDVTEERDLIRRLLKDELSYEAFLEDRVTFNIVSWEDPAAPTPMPALLTPQEAVVRFKGEPSTCEIVIVVLWSRLGTHLDLAKFRKDDGEPYLSGTEWEFENAVKAQPRSEIFVYRRTEIPKIELDDPDWEEKRRQYQLVERFCERISKRPDGSFGGNVVPYGTPSELKERLAGDMKRLLRARLGPGDTTLVTVSGTPARLPPRPRLLGRDRLLKDLVGSLLAAPPPPVPVLGGPGIGKTTLSLAALHDPSVVERFSQRRFFVRCEPAATAEALVGEIARAVGLALGPDLEARLFGHFEASAAVLVLDNAETPWEADTEATERLLTDLAGVPGLALVATVRSGQRPLGPAWRETIMVGPLPFQDAKQAFLAVAGRRHAADPLLDILLGALDGLPLAIELMAHRAEPEPGLSELWRQWQYKRAELLRRAGGKSRLNDAAISFELSIAGPRMTAAARRLLSIAALLPDGVAHGDLGALLPREAGEAAQVLRAVGLAHDERGRLRLLAPVREHVAQTHPPDRGDLAGAMRHYGGLARTLGPQAGTEGGAEAIARLAAELANVEAIALLGFAAPEPSEAITATHALTKFWVSSGLGTGQLLQVALAVAQQHENGQAEADCIRGLGDIALARSEYEAAQARYEEALALYRRKGNVQGEADCILRLGDVALARSDREAARARYEEALALYRRKGDVQGEADCILRLGNIALRRSEHELARARFDEALALYHRKSYALGEANCIKSLGSFALVHFEHDAARARYDEALALYRRVGNVLGEANCIKGLGEIARTRSEHDAARARYEEALALYRRVGNVPGEAGCIKGLGHIARARSQHDAARGCYEEALALYRRVGNVPGEAGCIDSLGDIARIRFEHDAARTGYEEALALYRRAGDALGEANCIKGLGDIEQARSEHKEARARYEEALALYLRIGNVPGEASCIVGLGHIARDRSEHDVARARYEEALALYRRVGNVPGEAGCIDSLGDIARIRFEHDAARTGYEEALALYRRVGNVPGEAGCILGLGHIAQVRSEHDVARARYEEALALYRRVGNVPGEAGCIVGLGDIAQVRSEPEAARTFYNDALALYILISNPWWVGFAHVRLAKVAAGKGRQELHHEAARAAWSSIARDDLIRKYLGEAAS